MASRKVGLFQGFWLEGSRTPKLDAKLVSVASADACPRTASGNTSPTISQLMGPKLICSTVRVLAPAPDLCHVQHSATCQPAGSAPVSAPVQAVTYHWVRMKEYTTTTSFDGHAALLPRCGREPESRITPSSPGAQTQHAMPAYGSVRPLSTSSAMQIPGTQSPYSFNRPHPQV